MTMIRDTEIVDTAVAEPEGDNHARHTNASDIDTVRSPRRSMSRIGLAVAGATVLACSVLVLVTIVTDDRHRLARKIKRWSPGIVALSARKRRPMSAMSSGML